MKWGKILTAVTRFKVIQGYRFGYQLKDRNNTNSPPILHRFEDIVEYKTLINFLMSIERVPLF